MDDKALKRFLSKCGSSRDGRCREWLAGKSRSGYGNFVIDGRAERAHRVAYEHWVGPIPEGYIVHHHCRNKGCVEPSHLEAVTNSRHRDFDIGPRLAPRGDA